MMGLKKNFPNLLTLGNLFSGIMAIMLLLNENYLWATVFVFVGLFLDFFDGFAARLLKVSGEMGKQLDSLADMVTFGVVPAFAMYQLMKSAFAEHGDTTLIDYESLGINLGLDTFFALPAFVIALFSALRLAKFNIDTRQSDSFIGVPTPAVTFFVLSLLLIWDMNLNETIRLIMSTPWVLFVLTIVLSMLLVSEFRLIALKFKDFSFANNKYRFVLIGLSLILLLVFKFVALPLIFISYLLISLIQNITEKE